MKRLHQCVFIVSVVVLSWLGMMVFHEFGHVVGAWATGGKVSKVVLHPLVISQTDVSPNPNPLAVVWAGPVVGILLPLMMWLVARHVRLPGVFVLRFFAGFCLIANGVYIGFGSFNGIGDAGDMIQSGSGMWHLWAFGIATAPLGLMLWNGLGTEFGLAKANGDVSIAATYLTLGLLVVLVAIELACFNSQ